MDTIRARSARRHQLTNRQREIIIGSLLGDGHLVRTTRGFAFRVNHGIHQKTYVDWKFRELEALTNSPPRTYERSYYFRTVSHPDLDDFRKAFYDDRRKKIPSKLERWMSPLVLAVWLMDDGGRDKGQLRLNTQSFSREENEALIRILEATLGISAVLNRDKDLFRLRIPAASMPRLRHLVAPHIISSMRYKLSP